MPRGHVGAAGLQTIHTKLLYINPSMTISSIVTWGPHGANAGIGAAITPAICPSVQPSIGVRIDVGVWNQI